jgi:hypothetical protein
MADEEKSESQVSAHLRYEEVALEDDIAITGYPLAQLFNDSRGNLQPNGS